MEKFNILMNNYFLFNDIELHLNLYQFNTILFAGKLTILSVPNPAV